MEDFFTVPCHKFQGHATQGHTPSSARDPICDNIKKLMEP